MSAPKIFTSPVTWLSASLFLGAVISAANFNGPEARYLALSLTLVFAWLVVLLHQRYRDGLEIPRSPLVLSVTLLWFWLGLSISWSVVPPVSSYTFWWMSVLPLAFLAYTLAPDRSQLWKRVTVCALPLAVALAVMGIVQTLLWGEPAQSIFRTQNTHAAVLNLVALPASAYFLIALGERARTRAIVLGGVMFTVFFGIAVTGGRGGIVSLTLGLIVLLSLAARLVRKQDLTILAALALLAFALADLGLQGQLASRMQTLAQPANAAFPRLVIWQPAWELVKQSPWLGSGIGTYYLVSAAYRHPQDTSAGFFAHNDYLQLWLETGLPGLVLLLASQVCVLWLLIRAWRCRAEPSIKIEVAGLFAGLLAIAVHSLVDFNFYILVILLVTGLMLGRFHELVSSMRPARFIEFRPARIVSRGIYGLFGVSVVLWPISYLSAQALSDHFRNQAWRFSLQGELPRAERALDWAKRLTPADSRVLNARAELYRHALVVVKDVSPRGEREALFQRALDFLAEAERLNSLRAITFDIKARLYQDNPDLAGHTWRELAMRAYQQALRLDPTLALTREAYVRLLIDAGEEALALAVIEKGLAFGHSTKEHLASLLGLAAELKRRADDAAAAAALEARATELRALSDP